MRKLYKAFLSIITFLVCTYGAFAQQPALLINRFFTNPSGDDSPFEFAELVATRDINFATETFTIVFADGGNGGTAGWASGSSTSYGFQITSGSVTKGQLIYVGGSGLSINGSSCKIVRQINTANNGGDGFGSSSSGGVLGNGGDNADGLAVFNMPAGSLTSASIPVDAVFYGSSIGSAASVHFTTPHNDLYNGGLFGTSGNTFLAPDPASGEYEYAASGTFSTTDFTWVNARSFSKNTQKPNCGSASNITFQATNSLSFGFNAVANLPYLQPPYVSGVINDSTDPAAITGITVSILNNNLPIVASDYTLTAASSNTSVVTNSNIYITKFNGSANIRIVPTGIGYSNITLTLTSNAASKNLTVNYAASAPSLHPKSTYWHTSIADASAALALDTNYMVIGNDESNYLYVFSRQHSGLPLKSFYYGDKLALTDGAPDFKEVDVEAYAPSPSKPGRSYWLGSMSNSSSFNDKPNRNRLFAVDISGTGMATGFSFIGYTATLRQQLITWGDNHGYQFSASAAEGMDPKQINGFNVEGMAFAPNSKTLYIGFRAPLEPVAARTKAVIAPVNNFEAWFNNGNPSGSASIGNPIELDLKNRGIRDLFKMSNGKYVILAGNYNDAPLNPALFIWNGKANNAPVLQTQYDVTALNAEGVMETTAKKDGGPAFQVISDNGTIDFYNDGTEAKDLSINNFKKFRSDILNDTTTVVFTSFKAKPQGDDVKISFTVASPAQADSFEIRRYQNNSYTVVTAFAAQHNKAAYSRLDSNVTAGTYTYLVSGKSTGGSSFYSNTQTITISGLLKTAVTINPNPVTGGSFNLTVAKSGLKQVRIYDWQGELKKIFSMDSRSVQADVTGLSKGYFIIVITDADGFVGSTQFIVQ